MSCLYGGSSGWGGLFLVNKSAFQSQLLKVVGAVG